MDVDDYIQHTSTLESDCPTNEPFTRRPQLSTSLYSLQNSQSSTISAEERACLAEQRLAAVLQENRALRERCDELQEDFSRERQDKEKAISRLAEVEIHLQVAKRQLHQFNVQQMQSVQNRRQAALAQHQRDYEQRHTTGSDVSSHVSRSAGVGVFVTDSVNQLQMDGEGEDEID